MDLLHDLKLALDCTDKAFSVRFLIGLSRPDEEGTFMPEARRQRAKDYLSSQYDFGAFYDGTGLWKGQSEPCMMFEVIAPYCHKTQMDARRHASKLAELLLQEAVGLVFTVVEMELHS